MNNSSIPTGKRMPPGWEQWHPNDHLNEEEAEGRFTIIHGENSPELGSSTDAVGRRVIVGASAEQEEVKRRKVDENAENSVHPNITEDGSKRRKTSEEDLPPILDASDLAALFDPDRLEDPFLELPPIEKPHLEANVVEIRPEPSLLNGGQDIGLEAQRDEELSKARDFLLEQLKKRTNSPFKECETLKEALENKNAILEIKELDLGKGSLSVVPPEIELFKNLEVLNLSENRLTELPPQICYLIQLRQLYLHQNALTQLPPQICCLINLETLGLAINNFIDFPPQICNMISLKNLDLDGNNISELPPQICQLINLEQFCLSENNFIEFPLAICNMINLKRLYLDGNNIRELPPQIGQLINLDAFDLCENNLTELPPQIGQLRSLTQLMIDNNPDLRGLPLEILDLPHTAEISITESSLSEEVMTRLRTACNQPNYQGPRFSLGHSEQQSEQKPTKEILESLFLALGKPYRELSNVLGNDIDQPALCAWLNKLSYMKDFQGSEETKQWLIGNILNYLELADQDPAFRRAFSVAIQRAAQTCGDRVALSILHLGIQHHLATIDLHNLKALAEFLKRGVFAVSLLEGIARNKVAVLPFFDEIEVYLAYPVKLKERLGLPIDVQEMLYFTCSAIKQEDLDEAAAFVEKKLAGEEFYQFLIEQDIWLKALEAHFPEDVAKLKRTREDEANGDTPDYVELARVWNEGLIALSKNALVPRYI